MKPVTIEDMNEKTEFQDRNYLNKEIKEMFFCLDLIQSYDSGIRRAKNAMADNGSPKLVFEPVNDTDDYTMVTAYINEEFARVKAEEDGRRVEDDLKALGKSEKNVTEVVTELFSDVSKNYLKNYKGKQKATAEKILNAITSNNVIRNFTCFLIPFFQADYLRVWTYLI